MTNPVYELLTKAQELIRDPKNWTKDAYARTADRDICLVNSAEATCWCSVGALQKVMDLDPNLEPAYLPALKFLGGDTREHEVLHFNDDHSHAEVMELWDKAREVAKSGHSN